MIWDDENTGGGQGSGGKCDSCPHGRGRTYLEVVPVLPVLVGPRARDQPAAPSHTHARRRSQHTQIRGPRALPLRSPKALPLPVSTASLLFCVQLPLTHLPKTSSLEPFLAPACRYSAWRPHASNRIQSTCTTHTGQDTLGQKMPCYRSHKVGLTRDPWVTLLGGGRKKSGEGLRPRTGSKQENMLGFDVS